jgi:hypothetical protein
MLRSIAFSDDWLMLGFSVCVSIQPAPAGSDASGIMQAASLFVTFRTPVEKLLWQKAHSATAPSGRPASNRGMVNFF